MEALQNILDYVIFTVGDYSFKVSMIVKILLIILITRLLLYVIKRMLFRRTEVDEHEKGNIQAIYQIIS